MSDLIARDDSTRAALVLLWSAPAALGAALMVGADEAVVFFRDGRVLGVLGPGRYALDPAAIPFLPMAIGPAGAVVAQIYFVTTRPVPGVKVGGPLGAVRDAASGLQIEPRAFGELTLRIVDPARAVAALASAPGADPDATLQGYAQYATLDATRALVGRAGQEGRLVNLVMDPTAAGALAEAVADAARAGLAGAGLDVVGFGTFTLTLSEEDRGKLGAPSDAAPEEPVYEMLWDCKFCGTKKLLGATHRHCPSCGAPQNAEERYFPPDSEKVPAKNNTYYGADVVCTHCGEANSKNSKCCGGCGAPLDGAKDVGRRQDQVVDAGAAFGGQTSADARQERLGTSPRPVAAPPKRSGARVFLGVGCAVILALITAVVVMLLWKKDDGVEVAGHTWKRQVAVERFGPVSDSAWCDSMPFGARSVTRTREVRSEQRVPDGEDCRTRKIDKGNGTFTEKQECTPKYRSEPVYGERCHYLVDRWSTERMATAEGSSLTDAPKWPSTGLLRAGGCEGCEREGARTETYTVQFKDAKPAQYTCDFDQQKWASFTDGSKWKGAVRVLGGTLDCDSLKAP